MISRARRIRACQPGRQVIAVAGELWITIFRSMRYPEADAGCGRDHHALGQAADEFGAQQAVVQATRILREHRAAVLALTDRIERDSRVVP